MKQKIESFFSKKDKISIQGGINLVVDNKDKPQIVYPQPISPELNPATLRERRIVTLEGQNIEADIFKLLRTKIFKQLKENNWNSFGITSAIQGAGKSMIAANLAITMAMDTNQKILLVDMDLLYPKLDWYFNLSIQNGLKDCIVFDKPLTDILINPSIDRLTILPGKGQVTNTAEMLSSSKMRNLINEIKSHSPSRVIIFDLPPILSSDDVLASIDYYDALLFIVEDGCNKKSDIKKALQMVSSKPLLGTVLNKADSLPNYQRHYKAFE